MSTAKSTPHSDQRVAEIERLRVFERELERALAELEHQGRRYDDGLQRAGGHPHELHHKVSLNDDARRLTIADLQRTRQRLAELRAKSGDRHHD